MKNEIALRDKYGRFLEGHDGVIQKRFSDPEKMLEMGMQYIEQTKEEGRTPTTTGLALALGFRSRQSLLIYQKEPGYEGFFDVVCFLKMQIEDILESRLLDNKNNNTIAGTIFVLKNGYQWADRQEVMMESKNLNLTGFTLVNPNENERTN